MRQHRQWLHNSGMGQSVALLHTEGDRAIRIESPNRESAIHQRNNCAQQSSVRLVGPETRMFGASLANVFRTPDYDCSFIGNDQTPEFAITRIRSGPSEVQKAPEYPAERAILIWVSLSPPSVSQWHALYNGRPVGVTRSIPFATTFMDLNSQMQMWIRGPFDYLHYYLSAGLLERIAAESGITRGFRLREAFFIEDLVVAQLSRSILARVRQGDPLDRLTLDQIAVVLGAHTLQQCCLTTHSAARPRRGLESWQKLRAEEMLSAHLAGNIAITDLASACSLSESHFARCFRVTYGTSVHQRLIQLRIEHAKQLLSTTQQPLVEIALSAGFCDQAAFTRTFSRIEGVTPSWWRRFNER
jgi:AraC family transcriptional regulator